MTTHNVLRKARAYLLEHGWTQDSYGRAGGPRCMLGAVYTVNGAERMRDPLDNPTEQALEAQVGGAIARFNDAPGRTFDEVLAAFDAAIEATAPPKPDESPFTALEDLPAEQYIDCLSTLALIPAEALT